MKTKVVAKLVLSPRHWAWPVLTLLALINSGCLEFDRQTAFVVFHPKGDQLQALFVYEGLRVGQSEFPRANEEKSFQRAKEELKMLVEGHIFYVGSPLMLIPLSSNPKRPQAEQELELLLQKHLTIRRGFFVESKKGEFAYCQPIAVPEPHKLVVALNDMISQEDRKSVV